MKRLKAYRVFLSEVKDIQMLLICTKYSFEVVAQLKEFEQKRSNKRYLKENDFAVDLTGSCSFKKNGVARLKITLYQQAFVRLISTLEVFLVDIFRDVFIFSKKPFMDNSIIEYKQSQALSIKSISELFDHIINRECRRLSSGGFGDIAKAYKKKLDIDLFQIMPGKQKMTEYHDIRHLIVHRIGRMDTYFKNKYNHKKDGVSLTEDYLMDSMSDVKGFALKVNDLVLSRIDILIESEKEKKVAERQITYLIKVLDFSANIEFLSPDFQFWVLDTYEVLKNILVNKREVGESEYEMELVGSRKQIKAYYSYLKYAKKENVISIKIIDDLVLMGDHINQADEAKVKKKKRRLIEVDEKTIELIKDSLPSQPWPKGTHKQIAEQLGVKNRVVSSAIQLLIKKGVFKPQVNGVIEE